MNKALDKLVLRLRIEYILFWALTLLMVALYETGCIAEGAFVGNGQMEYVMQLLSVLITVALIPLSLKIFSVAQKQIVTKKTLTEAMASYLRWSEVRLFLLLSAVIFNVTAYYAILDNTGLFCAAMALLASLFCIPEKKHIYQDLELDSEDAKHEGN